MPRASATELKPFGERSLQEKISGLTTLVESMKTRQKKLVQEFGTDMPQNPSDAEQLRSIEESIMWKERSIDELRAIQKDEEGFKEHADATRQQIVTLLNKIGDLAYEDFLISSPRGFNEPATARQIAIGEEVAKLHTQIEKLKTENPLAYP